MKIRSLFLAVVLLSLAAFGLPRLAEPLPLSACTWVSTSCGSGCADNKDLYNCSSNVTVKSVSKSNSNQDSNAKAQLVAPPVVTQYIEPTNNNAPGVVNKADQNTDKAKEYITNTQQNGQQTYLSSTIYKDQTGNGGRIVQSQGLNVITIDDIINHAYDAPGSSGTCSACLNTGGGAAERQCYVQCVGSINTGICEGRSIDQCLALAVQKGYKVQFCSGTQTATGAQAGEFLSCGGTRSTGGCGQVDFYDSSGNLIGFVIDKSACTTSTPTPPPASSPPKSSPKPSPKVSPKPSPRPSPVPSPQPGQCVSISKSVQTPQLGNQVSFTCAPVNLATRYEFRYAYTTSATVSENQYQALPPTTGTGNTSAAITVDKVGRYVAMCRPCFGNNQCETWQVATLQQQD